MQRPQRAPEEKRKRRILVIDDNLDHVRSLAMMFDVMGHEVSYAINATVAPDVAAKFQPDVIFLDLLLPDGHGAKVCSALRSLPGMSSTKIYGITASSRMLDYQHALDAGCDDVLRKPVSPETFERLIAGGMSRRQLRDFIAKRNEKRST